MISILFLLAATCKAVTSLKYIKNKFHLNFVKKILFEWFLDFKFHEKKKVFEILEMNIWNFVYK